MERKSGDTLRKLHFFINFRRVSRGLKNISVAILKITGIIN